MAFLCKKDGSVLSWLECYVGDFDVSHEEVADYLIANQDSIKKDRKALKDWYEQTTKNQAS
jgi:hypothetical protein